jgi:hypothetical protein
MKTIDDHMVVDMRLLMYLEITLGRASQDLHDSRWESGCAEVRDAYEAIRKIVDGARREEKRQIPDEDGAL